MANPLTPPPSNFQQLAPNGNVSTPWMDWYVRLQNLANTSSSVGSADGILQAGSFIPPPAVSPLPPNTTLTAVDAQSILAGQIFGA